MAQSDKYPKSRAAGVTSEVFLTTDRRPSELSLCFSFFFCFSVLKRHGVFYTPAIPEVTWYEPLYNTNYFFFIKGFRMIVFIFIVISTTFRPICPPAFFWCLSNSGTFAELRTTSVIEFTGVTCSDSVSHNRVHELSISVLLLTCSQVWTCILQIIVSLEA